MLSPKLRRKLLMKWAQISPPSPGSPTSPASPASPGSPASPTAATTPNSTTSGAQNLSRPASSWMNLGTGWPNWTSQIDSLVVPIDKVIVAGTKAKQKDFNFEKLFMNRFPAGVETDFPPPDPTGDVIRFAKLMWEQIMNGGKPFDRALSADEMRYRVGMLLQSPYLQKLQQINPAGPLGGAGAQLSTYRNALQGFYNSLLQS